MMANNRVADQPLEDQAGVRLEVLPSRLRHAGPTRQSMECYSAGWRRPSAATRSLSQAEAIPPTLTATAAMIWPLCRLAGNPSPVLEPSALLQVLLAITVLVGQRIALRRPARRQ
jgi:hypothetical protein